MSKNNWDKFYKNTPLDKIPWNKSQADFFIKLLKAGKLGQGKALDLGCGVGKKSIELAKKGFGVVGVDISVEAIKYARENAKKAGVRVKFIVGDATDLSFLDRQSPTRDSDGTVKFDLMVDWANLHCIDLGRREKYIQEIVKYTKKGGKFLLRCFSKHGTSKMELGMITPMGPVYFFFRAEIRKLFGKNFKVLDVNRSRPTKHSKWFDEYLMERV